jgi:hypothetical protein
MSLQNLFDDVDVVDDDFDVEKGASKIQWHQK